MAKMKVFELKNLLNEKYNRNIESKDIQKFLEKTWALRRLIAVILKPMN